MNPVLNIPTNILHLEKDWAFFFGNFTDNQLHQHYAVQVSVGLNAQLRITAVDLKQYRDDILLIQSNVEHQLESPGNHLLLLFDPFSKLGHALSYWSELPIAQINHPAFNAIASTALLYQVGKVSASFLTSFIIHELEQLQCTCSYEKHLKDNRIVKALEYIQAHADRTIPLEEIAGEIHLSESRFIHLFKQETGMTYRRAQLWSRICQSIPFLRQHSITQTAHQFGFTDSAHYTRTFKENFGFSPKVVKLL